MQTAPHQRTRHRRDVADIDNIFLAPRTDGVGATIGGGESRLRAKPSPRDRRRLPIALIGLVAGEGIRLNSPTPLIACSQCVIGLA
jgi:hypothetical protein